MAPDVIYLISEILYTFKDIDVKMKLFKVEENKHVLK
jgi:hypothetical protein